MGILTANLQHALPDIAPAPNIAALAYDMPVVLILVVLALVALAIVLIVRARRKNKAKKNQGKKQNP